jgi:HTH-type transcriptional regulator / antitoxin HigA
MPADAAEGENIMAELLDFTKPHVLRNEAEYTAAIAEIDQLLDLDPPPHSEAYERLEFLSVLVHAYEEAHFPLEQLTTPQDVVTFMLEQKGFSHADLAQWLGGKSPMRAFLQGTSSLSLPQIEQLREHLGIPADLLLRPGTAPNTRMEPMP